MKELFFNRELSWLEFNRRVLEESLCENLPTFERLKFISIFGSNLDEFFMIRVGGLHDRALLKNDVSDNKTGMTSREQIDAILCAVAPLYERLGVCHRTVRDALEKEGFVREKISKLQKGDRAFLKDYFQRQILPLLSPQIIDSRHPFPHLENKLIYVVAQLSFEGAKNSFGLIPISHVLPRVIYLPSDGDTLRYVLCEDLIRHNLRHIFQAYTVKASTVCRVTRNADIEVADSFSDEEHDYRKYMKEILKKRGRLSPVRLEFRAGAPRSIVKYLGEKLGLSKEAIFLLDLPLDMGYVFSLEGRLSPKMKERLTHAPMPPRWPRSIEKDVPIHLQAKKNDLFLFYPYDSMRPFLNLLAQAAVDEDVVSIKMTLYRLASDSQVIQHLVTAAENGKEVTVLLELKARFDEENNISISHRLEEAGCRVILGLEGFKVHSKACLVTRRTTDGIETVCHLGTGNYNEKTARLYSDVSVITSNEQICADVVRFFHNLTTNNPRADYPTLLVAPTGLKTRILALIDEQVQRAKEGKEALIRLKMNSLTDRELILALLAASKAGVQIRMIVRGICCLRPGVEGESDNIEVKSIVGRYLEHSRIFLFGVGDEMKAFISSADFMTRNTQRRVEIATPIFDETIKKKLSAIVDLELADNQKSHLLLPDG
ncbi:MAG: polyphosphate kinase 1, partial [Clostridia bacterium]|nr:polyphosphate kinase 1 [Clostridia bacterium]